MEELEDRDIDLNNRFTYYKPTDDNVAIFPQIRKKALELARFIDTVCSPGRETSLAITKLEEVTFWANAGLARQSESG